MSQDKKNNLVGQPILTQLLNFIPPHLIEDSVKEYQSDRYYKTVRTKEQFIFMFYAVLTGNSTLREVIKSLNLFGSKLTYCGLQQVPKRSSVSDANSNRNPDVFGSLYLRLYVLYKSILSDSYLHLPIGGEVSPDKVEIFDSTTISLFTDILKASGRNPDKGRKKGGIKAFTKIKLSERTPNFISFSSGASNDKNFLKVMELEKGSIAVFDKGFHDYSKYKEWNDSERFYVTRLNDNGVYQVLEQRTLGDDIDIGVKADTIIELNYYCKESKAKKKVKARLISYTDPIKGEQLQFLSNQFDIKASTICLLYKNRWTIEPLFKQIKGNFELTYFLSASINGIKTQIWIALILNLIFTVIHKMIKEAEDFATMVKVAAKNLISYTGFINYLKDPLEYEKKLNDKLRNVQLSIWGEGEFLNSA